MSIVLTCVNPKLYIGSNIELTDLRAKRVILDLIRFNRRLLKPVHARRLDISLTASDDANTCAIAGITQTSKSSTNIANNKDMKSGSMDYSLLNRAQLTFDYLHTNSTTHEFIFGALAELVDNSRDAGAENLYIYSIPNSDVRGGHMIYFLDDGCGMDAEEAVNVMSFGKSDKRSENSCAIGQYGNGLKSGSMRVANDFILFTKKNNAFTCLFLSRTFHEDENIKEVIVPIPSFDVQSGEPLLLGGKTLAKHNIEMQLILKYSPFHDFDSFMQQLRSINGKTGTMIILYNLKLLDNGKPELDVTGDYQDIRLACASSADREAQESLQPEWQSLREYVGVLYYDPRMKVHLQGKKVVTKKLISMLYKPRVYKYSSTRFKARAEQDLQKAQDEFLSLNAKVRELESRVVDAEQRLDRACKLKPSERTELSKNRIHLSDLKDALERKKKYVEQSQRTVKEPKSMHFVFGLNLDACRQDGMFVYNNSRLIRMYEKIGRQSVNDIAYAGVVGVVNVPLMILEPTHNKQNFADRQEYKMLLKAMKEHMEQYWKDSGFDKRNMIQFWTDYGYDPDKIFDPPSNDPRFVRKRRMLVSNWLQCDNCLKWRKLAFSKDAPGDVPENWICSMNTDSTQNRCSLPEKHVELEEGRLQKAVKSRDAECAIIQNKMEKLKKNLQKASIKVYSKRDVDNVIRGMTHSSNKPNSNHRKRRRSSSSEYTPRSSTTSKQLSEDLVNPRKQFNSGSTTLGNGKQAPISQHHKTVACLEATVQKDDSRVCSKGNRSQVVFDKSDSAVESDSKRWSQVKQEIPCLLMNPAADVALDKDQATSSTEYLPIDQCEHKSCASVEDNSLSDKGIVEKSTCSAKEITKNCSDNHSSAKQNMIDNYRTVILRLIPEHNISLRSEITNMTDDELSNVSLKTLLASYEKEQEKTMRCVDKQLASVHSELNDLRTRVGVLLQFLDPELTNLRPTPHEIRGSLERMIEKYEMKM
ncbi:hypothetical protein GJ496_000958 [Pomphorhynchus laevis]|nr:hypothetical protein GJ496_000958 [Pomphorhynchus laevis]